MLVSLQATVTLQHRECEMSVCQKQNTARSRNENGILVRRDSNAIKWI